MLAPVPLTLGRSAQRAPPAADGVEVLRPRYVVVPKVLKWTDGFFFALSILPRLLRLRSSFRFDLIDAHWGYPDGFAAFLLGRVLRVPVVVTVRGSDVNVFMDESWRGRLIRYYLRQLPAVIAVSAGLRRRLVAAGIPADHIEVIPNGVDTKAFLPLDPGQARARLGIQAAQRIITSVGHLVPIKGPDILLDAFLRLPLSEVTLVFVGDGAMREPLERRVRELPAPVRARVRFVGQRPHAEIGLWLAAADVVALASRNEGCPNVLLEAMACGRPVVAARVGGVEELVAGDQVGYTVTPEDPAALAEALQMALARDWDADAIRRHATRFSWTVTAERCAAVWRRVLEAATQTDPD